MSPNPALQHIFELEAELGLWALEPHGFPVWYSRRLAAYRRELTGERAQMPKAPQTKLEGWRRDADLVRNSIQDVAATLPTLVDGGLVLLTSSSYRRRRKGGTAPCVFSTHLEQQLGDRLQVFELDNGNIPREERPPNVASIDLGFGPSYRFTRQLARLDAALRPAKHYRIGRAFSKVGEAGAVALSLHARLVYEAALAWFRLRRPRAVFVICAYSHFTPIQLAAKRLGIPVIELQHGVIHESHPGYIFPPLGEEHFARLPVPDHLVVFGRTFGELLDENCAYWKDRWTVGGHPWLQETLASSASIDAAEICFFSQCEAPVRQAIRASASELLRLLPGVSIGIKPHPGEGDASQFYAAPIAAGALLYGRGDDSYALLKQTKMAVCVHSTVVIEALAFPCVPVAIESEAWTEAIAVLVEKGQIKRATSGADLAAIWAQLAESPRQTDAESMFAIGAPSPDFEQLIARVEERVKERRP